MAVPYRLTVQARHAERFGAGVHEDGEIHYTFYGDGAFLGRSTVDAKTKRELLSRLIALIDKLEDGWDEDSKKQLKDIGRRFYSLLVPKEARQTVFGPAGPEAVELDVQDHDIPWELLHDGDDFLVRRHAFSRRVMGPERPRRAGQRSVKVLIVADPTDDLDGAREEGVALRDRCQDALDDLTEAYVFDADVVHLEGAEAAKGTVLLDLLMDPDGGIDIFHVAGHSYCDPRDPEASGITLADGNLRAFEARSLECEPLVFVNGCRAGQSLDEALTFGAISGLAGEFLTGGAIGYIAPMWPVGDGLARRFAEAFYGLVIGGETIDMALLKAKQEIDDPEALAYVFFGRAGERLSIFSPQLTAGPYVNELGIHRIIELEREYHALELLAVNELPWILWDAEDIIEWTRRLPIDRLRQGDVTKSLLEYVQEFGELVKEGERRLFCILNEKTIRRYLSARGLERWDALAQELEAYFDLPNFTLILASSQSPEIEEIELVSRSSVIPPSPHDSVYVFNKQTRFEQSNITYNLFEDYNPQMITYYWRQFESLILQSLASYGDIDPADIFSGVASTELNLESGRKLEQIALEELALREAPGGGA